MMKFLPPMLLFHIISKFLKHLVESEAEAETTSIFYNGQEIIHILRILTALDHPQPPTPLKTDNSIASDFAKSAMKLTRSKSWDMCFHWLQNQ